MKNSTKAMFEGKEVVTAFAESARGPGWSNQPLWVVCRDRAGNLSMECIQPQDQTPEIVMLYKISQEVHKATVLAVKETIK